MNAKELNIIYDIRRSLLLASSKLGDTLKEDGDGVVAKSILIDLVHNITTSFRHLEAAASQQDIIA